MKILEERRVRIGSVSSLQDEVGDYYVQISNDRHEHIVELSLAEANDLYWQLGQLLKGIEGRMGLGTSDD